MNECYVTETTPFTYIQILKFYLKFLLYAMSMATCIDWFS